MACCRLCNPFDSDLLLRDAEEHEPESTVDVHHRTKHHRLSVRWHNLKFFAVPLTKRLLFYVSLPVFWYEPDSLELSSVPSSSSLVYYSSVLFDDDDCNTQWVLRLVGLGFVVLMLGAFM